MGDWYVGLNKSFTYVCFDCRKTAKRPYVFEPPRCPSCRKEMENMGMKFRPPKATATRAWKRIRRTHHE